MIDTRNVLDSVRNKIPPKSKMLITWLDSEGNLRAAHANMTQNDISMLIKSLEASIPTLPTGIMRIS